jgi:hypothetical protein
LRVELEEIQLKEEKLTMLMYKLHTHTQDNCGKASRLRV